MKINLKGFPWVGAIVSILLCLFLIALNFQAWQNQKQFAFKSKRAYLVSQMLLKLTASSEAEKSAVLAVTDRESKDFADKSRAVTLALEKDRAELAELLKTGNKNEKQLLDRFSMAFIELKQIDNELLDLAVKNTNLKAYALAFGAAADTLKEMYSGLSRVAAKNAGTPDAEKVMLYTLGAQAAALHLQTLLAPHISEESDKKMDDLEALMAKDDQEVRKELADLSSVTAVRDNPDMKKVLLNYDRFCEIKARIIELSRENTNILSLSRSLGHKRKALLLCQDLLLSLQQAIMEESNAGPEEGPVSNPLSPN